MAQLAQHSDFPTGPCPEELLAPPIVGPCARYWGVHIAPSLRSSEVRQRYQAGCASLVEMRLLKEYHTMQQNALELHAGIGSSAVGSCLLQINIIKKLTLNSLTSGPNPTQLSAHAMRNAVIVCSTSFVTILACKARSRSAGDSLCLEKNKETTSANL